jgi:hypothetical protein
MAGVHEIHIDRDAGAFRLWFFPVTAHRATGHVGLYKADEFVNGMGQFCQFRNIRTELLVFGVIRMNNAAFPDEDLAIPIRSEELRGFFAAAEAFERLNV